MSKEKRPEQLTKEFIQALAQGIGEMLPKNIGFTLLTFEMNKPGIANYASNCNRKDMIQSLFETAYRLKEKQDKVSYENSDNT